MKNFYLIFALFFGITFSASSQETVIAVWDFADNSLAGNIHPDFSGAVNQDLTYLSGGHSGTANAFTNDDVTGGDFDMSYTMTTSSPNTGLWSNYILNQLDLGPTTGSPTAGSGLVNNKIHLSLSFKSITIEPGSGDKFTLILKDANNGNGAVGGTNEGNGTNHRLTGLQFMQNGSNQNIKANVFVYNNGNSNGTNKFCGHFGNTQGMTLTDITVGVTVDYTAGSVRFWIDSPDTYMNDSGGMVANSAWGFKMYNNDGYVNTTNFPMLTGTPTGAGATALANSVVQMLQLSPVLSGNSEFVFDQIKISTGEYENTVAAGNTSTEDGVTELYISKFGEGSGNNKFIEIYNGTDSDVDLSGYSLSSCSNGCDVTGEFDYPDNVTFPAGTILASGDVYVVAHGSADPAIAADQTFTYLSNGDDFFALTLAGATASSYTIIDALGDMGPDPGSGWDVAGVTNGTKDHTLTRKWTVCGPNPNELGSFGTSAEDSEWIVGDQNSGWDTVGSFTGCTDTQPFVAPSWAGDWVLDPVAGALAVGPSATDLSWWSNSAADVDARTCQFDDIFSFNADGTFAIEMQGSTWLEPSWQAAAEEGCGTPIAPHDGSNAATYSYTGDTVTVVGDGAFLGLAKVHNGGEDGDPVDDTITYNIVSVDDNYMVVNIQFGAGWWQFRFRDASYTPPPPAEYDVTFNVDMNNSIVPDAGVFVGGGILGDAQAHQMSDPDGDGVYTVTITMVEGTTGDYIFLNGPGDGGDWGRKEQLAGLDCGQGANNDRLLPPVTADATYSFCFGSCDADCGAVTRYDVTFNVDTSDIEVGANGMTIGGGIMGGANAFAMTDADGDGIYTRTISVPAGTTGNYVFLNNTTNHYFYDGKEDLTGQDCADGQFNDRLLAAVTEDTTVQYCFATCEVSCTPPTPGETCDHTFVMNDSYGDGWNGWAADILVGGEVVYSGATIENGAEGTVTFSAESGQDVEINWATAGSYASEISWSVLDNEGTTIGSGAVPSANATEAAGTAYCPPPPSCSHSFVMTDSYGDGWNGWAANILVGEVEVVTGATIENGSTGTATFDATEGDAISVVWAQAGSYASEVSWEILDGNGLSIASGAVPSSGLVEDGGVANCTPPSCPAPTDLSVSGVTPTGATLSWVSDGTAFMVELQPAGSPQGTAGGYVIGDVVNLTTTSVTIPEGSLMPYTAYDFYVINLCADSQSDYAGPGTFTTLIQGPGCGETFSYDYPTGSGGGYQYDVNFTEPNPDELVFTSTVDTAGDWLTLTITGTTENNYDWVYVTNGAGTVLQLPVSGAMDYEVVSEDGTVNVYVGSDSSITAGPVVFSVACSPEPSCYEPSDLVVSSITNTSATLSWTAGGTETQWEYQIVESGVAPAETGTTTTEGTVDFTDLTGNTSYDVYLRANCDSGDNSDWASVTFITIPSPLVPDYLNDFTVYPGEFWTEGDGAYADGPDSSGISSWGPDGFANDGFEGAARMNIYSTFPQEWLISPNFDLSGGTYELTVDAAATEYASTTDAIWGEDDFVALMVTVDGGTTWTELYRWDATNNPGAAGAAMPAIELSGYDGVTQFAFYAESTVSNEDIDFFIDNFSIATPFDPPTWVGDWVLDPVAGALAVGPTATDLSWWSNSSGDVDTRDCQFDDIFSFNEDGTFAIEMQGSTWLEPWQGVDEGCGTPIAPHDGSNPATYSYDDAAQTITVVGEGAFLGLPKVHNNGEDGNPVDDTITYNIVSVDENYLVVNIQFGAGWWQFRFRDANYTPPADPQPEVCAPVPTHDEADVISVYSDAYTVNIATNLDPDWGQATDATEIQIGPDSDCNTLQYAGLNYQGLEYTTTDVTGMDFVHLDYFTFDSTDIRFSLISPGAENAYDIGVELGITTGEWVSVDIPLSFFTVPDQTGVFQFKTEGNGSVFLDNLYFWNDTAAGLDDPTMSEFTYFPNPVNDQLTISAQVEVKDITVFNMLGQVVIRQTPNMRNCTVDMSSMQTGAYFVQVSIGNTIETVRVLKK